MSACSQRDDQARRELATLQGEVARLTDDNRALRQRLEELAPPANANVAPPQQRALLKRQEKPTLDTRLSVVEPPAITSSTNIRDAAAMTRAYLAGVEAVRTGNSKRGIPLLRQFARSYPWDARAADALYFAGTAALANNQAQVAAEDFATLVRLYPKNPLVPEALTRKGECAARIGRFADAQEAWKHVATNYSGTAAAQQAQLLLQNVQRKEHP